MLTVQGFTAILNSSIAKKPFTVIFFTCFLVSLAGKDKIITLTCDKD